MVGLERIKKKKNKKQKQKQKRETCSICALKDTKPYCHMFVLVMFMGVSTNINYEYD